MYIYILYHSIAVILNNKWIIIVKLSDLLLIESS